MVIYGCVLAKVEINGTPEALDRIRQFPEVGMVVTTTGPHDLLILIKANSPEELGRVVVEKIQGSPVIETLTLVLLNDIDVINWLADHH